MSARPIYLDYAATTPVDPRVAAKMSCCLTVDGCFANPASRSHVPGRAPPRPVALRVAASMRRCLTVDVCFANPASSSHVPGREARGLVETARVQVADAVGRRPTANTRTPGRTGADNTAI